LKAPKCANCGAEMLATYTKQGLRLYICPHVNIRQVAKVTGKFYFGEIHCYAKIKGLRASFEQLMIDNRSTTTLAQLRAATHNTVSDGRLLENANLAAMLEIPCDELPAIFEATYKLSLAMGIDIDYGITSLCKGIARKRMVILDNIGITFNPDDAYSWYKTEYGLDKQPDWKLSQDEKDKAWKLFAIKTIKEKVQSL